MTKGPKRWGRCRLIRAAGPSYQPTITRLPSLICLLLCTLALIALVELACRRLPVHESEGIIKTVKGLEQSEVQRRAAKLSPQGA